MITQSRLRQLLHYCPKLGIFWWKKREPTDKYAKAFNTRWAGEIAGDVDGKGYATIRIDGRPYLGHRLAWLYMTGDWPDEHIDHANTYKLDNAFTNLRLATHSDNMANRRGRSVTGYKGVYTSRNGRFTARIQRDGGRHHLGTFDDPAEAHAVFMARAMELHGKFARS